MPTGVRDEKGIVGKRGYMQMKYGYFNPIKPRVEDVDIRSIAYGLAGEYRYSAQSRLTVAQHSVVGSYYCDEPLAFLLHDAAEGLGFRDVTTVLKHSPALLGYRKLELKALSVIYEALNIPALWGCAAVKSTDRAMYVTESFAIWKREVAKGEVLLPFTDDQTRLWGTEEAEHRFLQRYSELTGTEKVLTPFSAIFRISESPAKTAGAITSAPSRPPNSFTHAEYVKENGVSSSSATAQIAKLRERGVVKPVRFSVVRSDGQKQTVGGWQLVDTPIDSGAKNA